MAFNMFYGIFLLMLFLHMQRVIPADKIHRSKGYGGYGYGGDAVPWTPIAPSDILCSYCQFIENWPCIKRFCQRGYRGYGYGGYAVPWTPVFGPEDILCSYCQYIKDWDCIRRVCQRGFSFGGYGGYGGSISGYAGFGHHPHQNRCYYCWISGDGYCFQQFCYPSGKKIIV